MDQKAIDDLVAANRLRKILIDAIGKEVDPAVAQGKPKRK